MFDNKITNILLTVSAILFVISLFYYNQFLMIASGVFFGIVLIWIAQQVDSYVLKGIDTQSELKKGNVAYAIYYFSFCFLLGIGFLSAVLIFFTLK